MLRFSKKFKKPLPSDLMKNLANFISETSTAIDQKTFRPMKYTDPKGARRFTLLPVYSFQLRHISLDNQSFSHILHEAGLRSTGSIISNKVAREEYFRLFNMARIGYPTLESLQTEKCEFWLVFHWNRIFFSHFLIFYRDKIRTNGTDVEFMFKKAKRPKPPPPLQPADLKDLLGKAILWGVDPGVTDVFVAVDGACDEPHRVRRIRTKEYYSICGYNKAAQKRQEFVAKDPEAKTLIDGIPSLKTADLQTFLAAIQYRLRKPSKNMQFLRSRLSVGILILLTWYFKHAHYRYSKLKLKTYMNKQTGMSEVVKCLLGGSKKYTRTSRTEPRTKGKERWQCRSLNDSDDSEKPVIIAYGNASFSASMKNKISGPYKLGSEQTKTRARNRKVVQSTLYWTLFNSLFQH